MWEIPQYITLIQLNLDWNDDMFEFLEQANNESEKLWTVHFKYLVYGGHIVNEPLAVLCVLISYWVEGEVVGKYLYHPFHN